MKLLVRKLEAGVENLQADEVADVEERAFVFLVDDWDRVDIAGHVLVGDGKGHPLVQEMVVGWLGNPGDRGGHGGWG